MRHEPTVFLIRHGPGLRDWTVGINEIKPDDVRFTDECASSGGTPGLVAAIAWCFKASAGNPSLLIIECKGRQYRLRFHSEPDTREDWHGRKFVETADEISHYLEHGHSLRRDFDFVEAGQSSFSK